MAQGEWSRSQAVASSGLGRFNASDHLSPPLEGRGTTRRCRLANISPTDFAPQTGAGTASPGRGAVNALLSTSVAAISPLSQGGGTGSNPVGAASKRAGQRPFLDLLARLAKPSPTRPANRVAKTAAPGRRKKRHDRAWRVSAATSTRRPARQTTGPALGPPRRASPSRSAGLSGRCAGKGRETNPHGAAPTGACASTGSRYPNQAHQL